MIQRIPFQLQNKSSRSLLVSITDRAVEIETTSVASAPDQLPPMSMLKTFLGDDDVVVLTADGIGIEKREGENNV